jgi:xylulokinase
MTAYTVGVDVGTTGTKTVLLDVERGIIAQASRESTLYALRGGYAEADPEQWHSNVVATIAQVMAKSGVDPARVLAVSATGMVPAVLPLDVAGRPLRKAMLQNDARATAEIKDLAAQLEGIDLVTLAGSALSQQSVAPTAVWLARHEPEVWAKTATLAGSYDWILQALGAERHVERNWALESGLFTIAGEPIAAVLDAAGIDPRLLPPVLDTGTKAGELSAEAAEATGLKAGTALIVGGADHVLSAFAAGVENDGDWLIKLGGAGDILAASSTPIVDERLYLDAHPKPGLWLPNGCMATSGSLLRWLQHLLGNPDLTTLDEEAMCRPPAEVLCLPYFLGEKSPINDPALRGTYAGLHLGHTRADMYRASLEAIAFGFRHNAEVFQDIGVSLTRALVTNGGSKSLLWKQIHAEVLGTELLPVIDHPGASLGAAILGAIGTGGIGAWGDATKFVKLGVPILPDPHRVEIYDIAYRQWRELGDAVAPISHAIASRTQAQ